VGRARFSLVLVPLLLGGTETAHAVVERFASEEYAGAEVFAPGSTGRELLPWLATAAVGVAVALIAAEVPARLRGGRVRSVPLLAVAPLPLLVFALQEYLEYWAGNGDIAWTLAASPPFLFGLALQVPFAVAALLAARVLLRAAVAIVVGGVRRPRFPTVRLPVHRSAEGLAHVSVHAARGLTRGPPLWST
jgi:hypothetical protein